MFRQMMAESGVARTPTIEWDLTNDHILTMEYIDGYSIEQLVQSGSQELRRRMARKFFGKAFFNK